MGAVGGDSKRHFWLRGNEGGGAIFGNFKSCRLIWFKRLKFWILPLRICTSYEKTWIDIFFTQSTILSSLETIFSLQMSYLKQYYNTFEWIKEYDYYNITLNFEFLIRDNEIHLTSLHLFRVTREVKSQVGRYCYYSFVNTTNHLSHTCTRLFYF